MQWEKFRTLADQYEIATDNLITISRRALAGDMAACADPAVLDRVTAVHAEFVAAAAEVFADAGTEQPGVKEARRDYDSGHGHGS
jgi:hypothetical protein